MIRVTSLLLCQSFLVGAGHYVDSPESYLQKRSFEPEKPSGQEHQSNSWLPSTFQRDIAGGLSTCIAPQPGIIVETHHTITHHHTYTHERSERTTVSDTRGGDKRDGHFYAPLHCAFDNVQTSNLCGEHCGGRYFSVLTVCRPNVNSRTDTSSYDK